MKNSDDYNFGLNISIINRAAQSYFYHKLKPYKIGPGQQAYILAISPGENIVQEELARRLNVDKANVTRAVRDLEKHGYILRVSSNEDKRSKNISLTKKGTEVRAEIECIAMNWIETLKTPLSKTKWNDLNMNLQSIAEYLIKPPEGIPNGQQKCLKS